MVKHSVEVAAFKYRLGNYINKKNRLCANLLHLYLPFSNSDFPNMLYLLWQLGRSALHRIELHVHPIYLTKYCRLTSEN